MVVQEGKEITMPTALEQSLFKTLAYFAFFSFPLTVLELWKWCDAVDVSLFDIESILSSSFAKASDDKSSWLVEQGMKDSEGFFGIGDVSDWREERLQRVTDALRKHRRAERFVRFASCLPWVRMIAVCNSLAFSFTNDESDIDLFVVTKRGRIWSTRFILTGVLALFRLRPGERKRDPLCLSFFVADDSLDFSSIKIGQDDPYLAFWIATLSPVFDPDDVLSKLRAANGWIRQSLPRAKRVQRARSSMIRLIMKLPDVSFFERFAERMQRNRFPALLRGMMNSDTRVVVTDGMLKFHHNDRRQEILNAYEKMVFYSLGQLDDTFPIADGVPLAVANAMDV